MILQVTLRLKGHALGSSRCCIFPPAVFYILSKINEDGSYIVVYRSEAVPGDSPVWLPVTISIRSLCNGDKDRGLQFHFFQEGFNGYHTSLGFALTSVNRMKAAQKGAHVKLIGKNGKVGAKNRELPHTKSNSLTFTHTRTSQFSLSLSLRAQLTHSNRLHISLSIFSRLSSHSHIPAQGHPQATRTTCRRQDENLIISDLLLKTSFSFSSCRKSQLDNDVHANLPILLSSNKKEREKDGFFCSLLPLLLSRDADHEKKTYYVHSYLKRVGEKRR